MKNAVKKLNKKRSSSKNHRNTAKVKRNSLKPFLKVFSLERQAQCWLLLSCLTGMLNVRIVVIESLKIMVMNFNKQGYVQSWQLCGFCCLLTLYDHARSAQI
ncbi:Predicted orf (plasmid) [Photobacterium profundum SS9]|uniref:Predicted orf n=1 Tax=Photobacterium profundum (strain SS9) TaxID=298386 RepID=Q6LWC5_PHOPR|nr:Predicted orf [Photobacterium profundum SS9]